MTTPEAARLPCPRCDEGLTPAEVRSLNAKLNSSLIRKRSGGKVWRKHVLNPDGSDYSRCRCKKCNAKRKR